MTAAEAAPTPAELVPRLDLPPRRHEHEWHLLTIHYEDHDSVHEFSCASCGDVSFR